MLGLELVTEHFRNVKDNQEGLQLLKVPRRQQGRRQSWSGCKEPTAIIINSMSPTTLPLPLFELKVNPESCIKSHLQPKMNPAIAVLFFSMD